MGIFDGVSFDDLNTIHQDGIDFLIDNGGLNCQLIYPDRMDDCPNCEYDSFTNRSSNVYTVGGPVPFTNGEICPYCQGVGLLKTSPTDTIKMILIWNPKEWISVPNMKLFDSPKAPNTYVQTWGYVSDIPKILNATNVRMQSDLQGYIKWDFRIIGEPVPQGFKSRYFVCMWERVGGA